MTSNLFRRIATLVAAVALTLAPQLAAAQDGGPVHLAVGWVGAGGFPDSFSALRVSGIGARVGIEFDAGLINDGYSPADRFLGGQLRFLPMRRKDNGTARSFFIGLSSRDSWGVTSQIGYGQEWLGRRWRVGFDWVMSGHGVFGKLFVVWGGR